MIKQTIITGKTKVICRLIEPCARSENGFILPITMMISCLFLLFILHAIVMLDNQQRFYHAYEDKVQLTTLRENVLTQVNQKIQEQSLDAHGHFDDLGGTADYSCTANNGLLHVTLSLHSGRAQETDEMDYLEANGQPSNWVERTSP